MHSNRAAAGRDDDLVNAFAGRRRDARLARDIARVNEQIGDLARARKRRRKGQQAFVTVHEHMIVVAAGEHSHLGDPLGLALLDQDIAHRGKNEWPRHRCVSHLEQRQKLEAQLTAAERIHLGDQHARPYRAERIEHRASPALAQRVIEWSPVAIDQGREAGVGRA